MKKPYSLSSLALACLIFFRMIAFPSFAGERSYSTEVINNVSIGDVSIGLSEYELNDTGDEIPHQGGRMIVPGDTVSWIVRISNLANPAWVRVRLKYTPAEGMRDFPDSCISPADERWIQKGGYYYLTVPLQSGEEADFIRELMIPPFWGEKEAGKSFSIEITAEAVQEANFDPDFTLEDPWFGTLIETCVHTPSYEPMLLKMGRFSVSFEGGAEGLVKIGDDFFENFGSLMPGDTVADMVLVKNEYSKPVSLYFRTEGIAEDDLAKEAQLTIRSKDGVIFKGRLSESREDVFIAELESGDEEKLIYSVFIPPECGNSYAMEKTADKWVFRASLDTAEKMNGSSSGKKNSGGNSTSLNAEEYLEEDNEPVSPPGGLSQTGESAKMAAALTVMAVSGLLLALILMKRGAE